MLINVDFLSSPVEISDKIKFGLCDNEGEPLAPAYINEDNESEWIAVIDNRQPQDIAFIPIDNNIHIVRENGDMANRCDGMLIYGNIDKEEIIFVELKIVRTGGWIPDGINQLKETILVFKKNHTLSSYKKRQAYLANRKKPNFQSSHKSEMERFKNELDVRLTICSKIVIK